MSRWTAVVIAAPEAEGAPMVSRLPSFLHPVAGRPLLWHTVHALATDDVPPTEIYVLAPAGMTPAPFDDLLAEVHLRPLPGLGDPAVDLPGLETPVVAVRASACFEPGAFARLLEADAGSWIDGGAGVAAAVSVTRENLEGMLLLADPFAAGNGVVRPEAAMPAGAGTFAVRTRADLARAVRRVRDQLVRLLMEGGTTFLLPDSVIVDVDVRVGRDTVIYPGVVLEGQTTIGDETVIGPGCRIIDSWVGSGVEMKGWNYIAHTSVRNRAILEPYVRRGFD